MRTIALTYYPDGSWTTKQSFSFAAGEKLRLRFTPNTSTDMTGKAFRLVFSDTPADAPLVNSTTFSFVSAGAGTFDFTNASADAGLDEATFEFPTDSMNVEIWNATDGILMRRYAGRCTANPRASGEAPAFPDPPIDWSDVANTPTTLAGYGITDAIDAGDLAAYLPLAGGTMSGPIYGGTLNVGSSLAVDWPSFTLNDPSNIASVYWDYRQLLGTDGTTVKMDWGGTGGPAKAEQRQLPCVPQSWRYNVCVSVGCGWGASPVELHH